MRWWRRNNSDITEILQNISAFLLITCTSPFWILPVVCALTWEYIKESGIPKYIINWAEQEYYGLCSRYIGKEYSNGSEMYWESWEKALCYRYPVMRRDEEDSWEEMVIECVDFSKIPSKYDLPKNYIGGGWC